MDHTNYGVNNIEGTNIWRLPHYDLLAAAMSGDWLDMAEWVIARFSYTSRSAQASLDAADRYDRAVQLDWLKSQVEGAQHGLEKHTRVNRALRWERIAVQETFH